MLMYNFNDLATAQCKILVGKTSVNQSFQRFGNSDFTILKDLWRKAWQIFSPVTFLNQSHELDSSRTLSLKVLSLKVFSAAAAGAVTVAAVAVAA